MISLLQDRVTHKAQEAEANHSENLKLNSKKMNLKITQDGLKLDPDKVKAVKNMPKPKCNQQALSLLSFINYLAQFLSKLSKVAQPLRDPTQANAQFIWSRQHGKAFEDMRKLVIQHPVLKYYDIGKEDTLQCDTSEQGLGATRMQKEQLVAFASRMLCTTEQRNAQIEKECLAIVFGCEKFSQYISRRDKVTVESDHKPLQSIFKKSLLHALMRLQWMMLQLQRYSLDVVYKPGSQVFVADHLSRAVLSETEPNDEDVHIFALELETMDPLSSSHSRTASFSRIRASSYLEL